MSETVESSVFATHTPLVPAAIARAGPRPDGDLVADAAAAPIPPRATRPTPGSLTHTEPKAGAIPPACPRSAVVPSNSPVRASIRLTLRLAAIADPHDAVPRRPAQTGSHPRGALHDAAGRRVDPHHLAVARRRHPHVSPRGGDAERSMPDVIVCVTTPL